MNGKSMAEKLGLGSEVRELKLGPSFTDSQETAFHTLRYDFKPASVAENKVATLDVGDNHQVTVTLPHINGSGTMQTVFKGCHRKSQRECVLIIDRTTGEITLEKLTNNIQLKKTRMEPSKSNNHGMGSSHSTVRPATPTEKKTSPPQRQSHKPPKNLGMPLPKHSPLPASPSYTNKSPSVYKSPPQHTSTLSLSPVAPGSLPMIGLEDPFDNTFSSTNLPDPLRHSPYDNQLHEQEEDQVVSTVAILSEESSSSNSSSDNDSTDSESDSSPANNDTKIRLTNGHINGSMPPADVLKADLELSESGSDSDC